MQFLRPRIKKIVYDAHFDRKFKKYLRNLGGDGRDKVMQSLEIFRNNPFDKKLGTHKLSGALRDYWAFSLNYSHRVIFRFLRSGEVFFVDIGGHEIYK